MVEEKTWLMVKVLVLGQGRLPKSFPRENLIASWRGVEMRGLGFGSLDDLG